MKVKAVCIYHSQDLDGWMSAAIVKLWHKKVHNTMQLDFLGWDYGDAIPNLEKYADVIMCDISFPAPEMMHIQLSGKGFIWNDHHISSINAVEELFLKKGVSMPLGMRRADYSACELTWMDCFPDIMTHSKPFKGMPEIVRLLGRWDCFAFKGTAEEQKVLNFQYGARMTMFDYMGCYFRLKESIRDAEKGKTITIEDVIHNNGVPIYMYLKTEALQIYKRGFPINLIESIAHREDTVRQFLCINHERFNPDNFGIDYIKDGYEGIASFYYSGEKWWCSLYSNDAGVNCSTIAGQYPNGGGHKGAARFEIENVENFIHEHKFKK